MPRKAFQTTDLLLQLESDAGDPTLVWEMIFGNAHPVEIELGIGKGRYIIDAAARNGNVNYVGVERASKYLRLAQSRCLKRELANIRFARVDAQEFVEFFVGARSVRAYHLYFPDPWPKKRHYKRRLFSENFLREAERTLEIGGRLWIATDHEGYFDRMLEVLGTATGLDEIEAEWQGARTNYEEKYLGRGKAIFRRVLEKVH